MSQKTVVIKSSLDYKQGGFIGGQLSRLESWHDCPRRRAASAYSGSCFSGCSETQPQVNQLCVSLLRRAPRVKRHSAVTVDLTCFCVFSKLPALTLISRRIINEILLRAKHYLFKSHARSPCWMSMNPGSWSGHRCRGLNTDQYLSHTCVSLLSLSDVCLPVIGVW